MSISDSLTDYKKCNGNVVTPDKFDRKPSSISNDSEEEIKFDLYFASTPEEEEAPKEE